MSYWPGGSLESRTAPPRPLNSRVSFTSPCRTGQEMVSPLSLVGLLAVCRVSLRRSSPGTGRLRIRCAVAPRFPSQDRRATFNPCVHTLATSAVGVVRTTHCAAIKGRRLCASRREREGPVAQEGKDRRGARSFSAQSSRTGPSRRSRTSRTRARNGAGSSPSCWAPSSCPRRRRRRDDGTGVPRHHQPGRRSDRARAHGACGHPFHGQDLRRSSQSCRERSPSHSVATSPGGGCPDTWWSSWAAQPWQPGSFRQSSTSRPCTARATRRRTTQGSTRS